MITREIYPKTYHCITEWFKGKTQLHGLPAEVNKLLDPGTMIDMLLKTNARVLMDFYDDKQIHVGVWHTGDGWRYNIHDKTGAKWNLAESHIGGETRMLTEAMAFEAAAGTLEKRL